jgi:hypothetical protein
MIDKEIQEGEPDPVPQLTGRTTSVAYSSSRIFPIFTGDGIMDPKKHMDQFLSICDIHLIEHDDVMVRVFLQTLIGPTYDWYLSLPAQSIGSLLMIWKICS